MTLAIIICIFIAVFSCLPLCFRGMGKADDKPWIKATGNGRLEVDTSHPEWKKWFLEQIRRHEERKKLSHEKES